MVRVVDARNAKAGSMQARGPLMVEHRLIERMIAVIEHALGQMRTTRRADPVFIDTAVDFIRTYADRTHHGKEEDIMFAELAKRRLSQGDRAMMNELIQEHVFGRKVTKALVEANARYRGNDRAALEDIVDSLQTLVAFYPQHISKEDKIFFPAARTYVTDEEDQAMLQAFWEFDRKLIHEKYEQVVERLAQRA
jgi:hemerythrin-like domain-containing protein